MLKEQFSFCKPRMLTLKDSIRPNIDNPSFSLKRKYILTFNFSTLSLCHSQYDIIAITLDVINHCCHESFSTYEIFFLTSFRYVSVKLPCVLMHSLRDPAPNSVEHS